MCGRNSGFKRRDATHFPFDAPVRGMNPTATVGHRYAIQSGHAQEIIQPASQSSAELHSAVSRICNPHVVAKSEHCHPHNAQPNAIRRYGRL